MAKYKFKLKPYRHQYDALRFLLKTGWGGALLMQPRTGKTKVVVDYASVQHQRSLVNRVLIFCPAGVMGVWPDEIEANCPFKHRVVVWDRRARRGRGKRRTGKQELPSYGKDCLDFVIVNYDALSTPGKIISRDEDGNIRRSRKRGGRYDIKNQLLRWQPDLVVLDESHRIKSPSAKKSTALHTFHDKSRFRIIMTGTVVTKKKRLFDIYSQWRFLNRRRFSGLNFGQFKSRYGLWKDTVAPTGAHYSKFLGTQNEDELHRLVHLDAFSVLRKDCYDLPPSSPPQRIGVELEESADIYDDMAADMVARIETGEITEASIKLVQRLRLQQITSGITKTTPTREHPEGRLVVIGSEKLRVLQSRLEDLFEAEEKLIIGAHFRADLARIEALVKKMGVYCTVVKGGVPPRERVPMAKAFERQEGPAVFVGQPGAMAEGIDLRSAPIMIWYSLPTSWVNFSQFGDRNALSEEPRFTEYLSAGGVDDLLWETLMEDEDIGKKFITSPQRLLRESGD